MCREQFELQRAEALQNLDTSKIGKSYTRKDWLNDIVDWSKAADSFHKALAPHIYTAVIETGKDAIKEVGQEPSMFDPFTPAIQEYFEKRALKVVQDVDDETKKQLRAALSQGVQDGEDGYQLRARVEGVFGNASTMRADRIARTETSRAQGFGDIQAWTQSGVVSGKEWFTAEDERVCDFCGDMDGKVVDLDENFFDKGDALNVGDKKLDLSYDDVASAPLHVGCRCVLLPVRD